MSMRSDDLVVKNLTTEQQGFPRASDKPNDERALASTKAPVKRKRKSLQVHASFDLRRRLIAIKLAGTCIDAIRGRAAGEARRVVVLPRRLVVLPRRLVVLPRRLVVFYLVVSSFDHVVSSFDHVVSSFGHVVSSFDHVVSSFYHVVSSFYHAVSSFYHVVSSCFTSSSCRLTTSSCRFTTSSRRLATSSRRLTTSSRRFTTSSRRFYHAVSSFYHHVVSSFYLVVSSFYLVVSSFDHVVSSFDHVVSSCFTTSSRRLATSSRRLTTSSRRFTTSSRRFTTPSRRFTTPSRRFTTSSRRVLARRVVVLLRHLVVLPRRLVVFYLVVSSFDHVVSSCFSTSSRRFSTSSRRFSTSSRRFTTSSRRFVRFNLQPADKTPSMSDADMCLQAGLGKKKVVFQNKRGDFKHLRETLEREYPKLTSQRGCYVKGKIEGKPAVMLIDSGCTNTLVHKKFLNHKKWTGNRITVLTATGERITVPLALLSFESEQGRHEEMVGVTDKLPVDCLLGRSSYGKSLAKQNILDQWEKNVPSDSSGNRSVEDEAFVLTRRQALEIAQQRADDLIDRENELSLKSLAKPDTKSEGLKEGDLAALFEDEGKPDLTSCESFGKETPVSEVPSNILDRTRTQLISDQKSDVTLEKVRKRALEKVPENEDGYFLDQELLLHRKIVKDLPESIRFMDRIVVPEAYRNEILRVAHTIPLAGHMGVKKTTDRITMHFFWPGVTFDIKKYCATCPQCQLVARKLKSNRAPLKPTEIITEPFKKVAIDLVGELPKSATGYKYILTIVDYATRYPEAIPLRTTSSKVIADALIQFFSRVGIPEELVSDQGSNFIGKLMTELYENLGITKMKTSVYHPEGNGLVERFHSTLKAMLKKFVGECVNTWDKYLPYLLFAYREVPSESIGYSPFELLYGHTIRGPLSVIKEAWLEKRPDRSNMLSYVLEMRKKLSTMQQVVQKNLDKAQDKQKQIYDAHSSRRKFDVGDKALVLLPTPGSKLEVKWQGPYTVTKVLKGGLNYELDTGKAIKQHRVYHINLLRKWQSRDEIAALVLPESLNASLPHEANVPPTYDKEDWRDVEISDELDDEQKQQIKEMLEEYSDVLSGTPNMTNAAIHQIDTGDSTPIRGAPYKIPQKLEEEVNKEIEKMLALGIIRPSTSPWASPVVIVPKPDGTIRFCVDYRKLNEVTKMDAYPIPSMERMIEKVATAKNVRQSGWWDPCGNMSQRTPHTEDVHATSDEKRQRFPSRKVLQNAIDGKRKELEVNAQLLRELYNTATTATDEGEPNKDHIKALRTASLVYKRTLDELGMLYSQDRWGEYEDEARLMMEFSCLKRAQEVVGYPDDTASYISRPTSRVSTSSSAARRSALAEAAAAKKQAEYYPDDTVSHISRPTSRVSTSSSAARRIALAEAAAAKESYTLTSTSQMTETATNL
ncbi:hypothetical protein QZH41_004747 [Actinostola sp. cb2023]|nr:hypothetical protein QZH41_004747 [Actinostola sp. cb2023]